MLGVRPEQAAVLRLALACITHPGLGSAALADAAPPDVLQLIGARLRGKTPARVAMVHMGRSHDIQHLGNSDQCVLRQVAHEDLGQARVGELVGWVRQAARRTGGDYVPGYSADLTTSLDDLFLVKDARGKPMGTGSPWHLAGCRAGSGIASLTSPELLEQTLAEVGWREDGASALLASTTTTRQVDFNSSLC